ncbi:MAG: hypothetical protein HOF11_20495, partial [Rhodospirillaceae bacterium]|nr:hypothetical protein [Rhodospirillaceae bacterium]
LVAHERLAEINPRLGSCSLTAYGKRGALKDEPPIEDLVLARMGVLGGMPGFRPPPVHVVHPLPTVGAAILACLGIAAALLAREQTGRGRSVETSLMAGALLYHPKVIAENVDAHVFQTHPSGSAPFYSIYQCSDGGWVQLGCVHVRFIAIAADHLEPHDFQTHPSGSAPFYSVYECADGLWVQLGCVHTGFINPAADLMGIRDIIAEPRFLEGTGGATPEDEAELRDIVAEAMKKRPQAEWLVAFEAADVPFGAARQTEDGMKDPQVIHNKMVMTLNDPDLGDVVQMGIPIAFGETPGKVQGPRAATATDITLAPLPQTKNAGTANMPPPLAGIRILEITNLIAGPTAGRLLADLGADVIKLEPLTGDLSRPIGRTYFYNLNFNKRSVSVNTSTDEGKQVVQRIASSCDALLANLRPGATARMGIGLDADPNMIEAHLTGYGNTGPYFKRPGIDPLAQALMGMSWAQGGPETQPVFPAQLAPTDYTNGAMGAMGTVLALFERTRHGTAQRVDGNLLNAAALISSAWFSDYRGRPVRPLADREQYGLTPFHRLFRLADGWVYVIAEGEAQERALCQIADVAWTQNAVTAGQHPNETPLAHALATALATHKLEALRAELQSNGIASAEAQSGDSDLFLNDPHTLENHMVATVDHPNVGSLSVGWQTVQFSNTETSNMRPTPLLGEQTAEAMADVGYSKDEIQALHDAGVVKTETPNE